jgi:hypothetical protein
VGYIILSELVLQSDFNIHVICERCDERFFYAPFMDKIAQKEIGGGVKT